MARAFVSADAVPPTSDASSKAENQTAARPQRPCATSPMFSRLTASVMDGDRQRCLEAGMNDHLAKPIDWDCLIALLNRMEGEVYGGQALAS